MVLIKMFMVVVLDGASALEEKMAEVKKGMLAKRLSGSEVLSTVSRVDRDKFAVEFTIDDLIKELVIDPVSPIAACNGCNACSKNISS